MPEQDDQFVQRRLLIASLLSAGAIMAYFYVAGPTYAPPVDTATVETATVETAAVEPEPATESEETPAEAAGEEEAAPEAEEAIQAAAEREIVVETDVYKIVLSNRGGVVKSWTLKGYDDALGAPLDLTHQAGSAKYGRPFRLVRPGGEGFQGLDDALFVVNEGPDSRSGDALVEFRLAANGRDVRKTFQFSKSEYHIEFESELAENGTSQLHLVAWPGGFGDTGHLQDAMYSSVFYWDPAEGSVERNAADDAEDARLTNQGTFPFAGIEDLFFAAAFRPPDSRPLHVETAAISISANEAVGEAEADEELFAAIGVGSPAGNSFEIYVGPKSLDDLRSVDPRMGDIIDFGWFSFVAEPLYWGLHWTHDNVVANWGWSIVILTCFINFALFPLKWKGSKSMKRMQQIQPLVKQLNDKYKGLSMKDPRKQKQNEELMELYSKYGVNPVGGCLPMILQLPFFYGFYKVLTVSIEMRGAEWLWVSDLSQPEQLAIRVLPLAMMGTQFWMQSLTPTPSVDPAQTRIMKFMPLMMGFIFYGFQAGLVLYWLTSNVVGVGQQVLLNKLPGEELQIEADRKRGPAKKKKK